MQARRCLLHQKAAGVLSARALWSEACGSRFFAPRVAEGIAQLAFPSTLTSLTILGLPYTELASTPMKPR